MNKSAELLNSVKYYKYGILIGIILGIFSVFLGKEIIPPFIIVFLGLGIGIFLVSLNKNQEDRNFLKTIFILAFLSRIIGSFLLYSLNLLLKGRGLFDDGWCYSENGYLILQMWLNGIKDFDKITKDILAISVSGTLSSYDFWNAFVYFFTGKSPLSLVFINCLAASLTVIIIYYITKQLSNKKAAIYASFLTAFWPSIFLWSIQNLKETITIFLTCVLVWSFVRIIKKFRFYLIFLIIPLSIALKEFRIVSFFIFYLLVLPLSLLIMIGKKNKKVFITLAPSLILFTYLYIKLFLVDHSIVLTNSVSFRPSLIWFLEWAYQMRTYRVIDANSAFLTNLDFTKPFGLIIFAPLALLFSWFAPFPWQLGSALQIMAIPEMLIFYLLMPFMFRGIRYVIRNKIEEGIIIVVYIFVMYFALAFLEGNIGTLFRHRALILPFIFVLAGIGMVQIKNIIKT